jgi:hypothetical protein
METEEMERLYGRHHNIDLRPLDSCREELVQHYVAQVVRLRGLVLVVGDGHEELAGPLPFSRDRPANSLTTVRSKERKR